MADTMIKYQCPTCTGPLNFDIEKQMLVCEYCESEFPEDYLKEQVAKTETPTETEQEEPKFDDTQTVDEVSSGFTCTSCGAAVVCDPNTVTTECMYCGNPIFFEKKATGMVKPDYILPFKIDKEKAKSKLLAFYNKKILLPKTFKDRNRVEKIAGMYVPFWLYSGKSVGDYNFHCTKTSSYRSGDYIVTKTKHYRVDRAGTIDYVKIPADASSKMEDNYMDGLEPYDYDDLCEFAPSYMAGFFADKYDVSSDDCYARAKVRVENSTAEIFKGTVSGYSSTNVSSSSISLKDQKVNYALLPVWMLNTKFNDKMYHFAINGQTGKVSGDLPIDEKKKKLIFWITTAISFIPFALLSHYLFF